MSLTSSCNTYWASVWLLITNTDVSLSLCVRLLWLLLYYCCVVGGGWLFIGRWHTVVEILCSVPKLFSLIQWSSTVSFRHDTCHMTCYPYLVRLWITWSRKVKFLSYFRRHVCCAHYPLHWHWQNNPNWNMDHMATKCWYFTITSIRSSSHGFTPSCAWIVQVHWVSRTCERWAAEGRGGAAKHTEWSHTASRYASGSHNTLNACLVLPYCAVCLQTHLQAPTTSDVTYLTCWHCIILRRELHWILYELWSCRKYPEARIKRTMANRMRNR